jgi:bacillithiol system protein YtxJ
MAANIRPLETVQDADRVVDLSRNEIVVIYKHSPICGASDTAIDTIGTFAGQARDTLNIFIVDVIDAREASQRIEELTGVRHESPQVLVLSGGAVIWHASHRRIRLEELQAQLGSLA